MKYSELYSQGFIKKLNEINDVPGIDENQSVPSDYIDVEDMLKKLGFTVLKQDLQTSCSDAKDNVITIDATDNKDRQRFMMAHELGHVFHQKRNAKRNDPFDGYSSKQCSSEVFANAFAAQLLMPKLLVKEQVSQVIDDFGIDTNKIPADEYDRIVSKTAKIMIVSKQAMDYRISKLKIFVPMGEQGKLVITGYRTHSYT